MLNAHNLQTVSSKFIHVAHTQLSGICLTYAGSKWPCPNNTAAGLRLATLLQTRSEGGQGLTGTQELCSACLVHPAPTESDGLWQIWSVLGVQSFHNRRGKQGSSCVAPRDITSPAAIGVGAYGTKLPVLKKRLEPFNRICSSKVFVAWLYSTCLGTNSDGLF